MQSKNPLNSFHKVLSKRIKELTLEKSLLKSSDYFYIDDYVLEENRLDSLIKELIIQKIALEKLEKSIKTDYILVKK
jgi:hypothetical protein